MVRVLTAPAHGPLEGVVEEVDTGRQARFRSENELARFLRDRLAEKMERPNEPHNQT